MNRKIRKQLDTDVYRLFYDLISELEKLDSPPSVENIILIVSTCRAKPMKQLRRPLRGGRTGFSTALIDVDVIGSCSRADPLLAAFSDVHELGHFWAGHFEQVSVPLYFSDIESLSDDELDVFCRASGVFCRYYQDDLNVGEYHRSLGGFDNPREYSVDKFATLVSRYLSGNSSKTSLAEKRLFSY